MASCLFFALKNIMSRGVWGVFDNFRNFQGGGGVPAVSLKWKILRGGGVLYDIPSVVGVWIFSGTTQSTKFSVIIITIFCIYLVP